MVTWRILLKGHLFLFPNGKFLFLDFAGRFIPVKADVKEEPAIKEIELTKDEFDLLRTALEAFANRLQRHSERKN